MAATDNLGAQFANTPAWRKSLPKPITASELPDSETAHETSQLVSRYEFRQVAARGKERLAKMAAGIHDTSKLHENLDSVTEHAYAATREPWGGATYNPRTGQPVNFHLPDKHALTARDPGQEGIELPESLNHDQFAHAMQDATAKYSGNLSRGQHYLGVFRDSDKHTIEIDPVVVAGDPERKHRREVGERMAQEISAATHATGGAYSFNTGNGVYPPHVHDVYTPPKAKQ